MDSFFVKPGTNKRFRGSGDRGLSNPSSRPVRGGRGSIRGGFGRSRRPGRGASRGSSRPQQNGYGKSSGGPGGDKKRFRMEDEEIESDETDEEEKEIRLEPETPDEDDEETEQEKRLRLTKEYLQQLEDHRDEKDVDEALKEEVLEAAGRLRKPVAQDLAGADVDGIVVLRGHSGHKLSVTCVTSDGTIVFSGAKEGTIIKWSVATKAIVKKIPLDKTEALGHSNAITGLSMSSDSRLLASGSADKLIKIWAVETVELFHTFRGHRDTVSSVVFRFNTHTLFSCSHDRNVKVWNVDEKGYVETLFGHQNAVTGIDSYYKERCITAGGQDSSVRIWKILEESQLVFQLPSGSIECISLVDDEHFVTGDDRGSVALWGTQKKKPIYTAREVHKDASGNVCWVASIDALKNSDIFVSGSCSGSIKAWRIQEGFKMISLLFEIPVTGFVNAVRIIQEGRSIVAGIGQEHHLGRWWRIKEAKNSVCVIPLRSSANGAEP